ncbi:DUF1549 and DUF1553 domain-containing protein [Novipirellula artificiosorum]|uniref:BIG2 domain-containing protein n=1 Tax=Novipirellula artificiosorum TaxID=2528016 RepID=A0A5C6E5M1_9BACT|nr:DUF1549 and DUF1553 domain-containing protein [Novipirellula artificiosorum]TWU42756.1 hypothetical protein Poly41_10560 [Novipirellula artificiosorum]
MAFVQSRSVVFVAASLLLQSTSWTFVALAANTAATVGGTVERDDLRSIAPLNQRFESLDSDEVPDFQKHIVPLIGRLGCNGRACHGSFQGRGGFQLSLFGYDFRADHEALLAEHSGRVDVDDVDESLILAKPTDAEMHEGGKRFDAGSWQHHVLRRWIDAGASFDANKMHTLSRLEVTPSEIHFTNPDESVSLSVIATWQDGTREEVTPLCRFSTNDDSIAFIDEYGTVTSGMKGDTHVVIYYDNAVAAIPVLRPIGTRQHAAATAKQPIDQLVLRKLDQLGIVSSPSCTDAEFIRRVSLDMTGVLPAGDTVREFLADDSPGKRLALVDELLESPAYAAWWATRLSDWTGNSEEQLNNALPVRGAASRLWHHWLRVRLEQNIPYDEIVAGIVEAQSREEDESYVQYCENMTEACKAGNENVYAQREGLPLYWARRNFQKPEDRAIGFAYTFLGLRIECAQCHKHPFDQWSKDDFDHFAQLFSTIRTNPNQVSPQAKAERNELLAEVTGGKKLSGGDLRKAVYQAAVKGKTVPFGELYVADRFVSEKVKKARALAKKQGRKVDDLPNLSGNILGQTAPVMLTTDPRPALMRWLRSDENPYFAKAIVNRVWSNYFGIGIVDPTDDMNMANPPSNEPLLDHLATEFIASGFDLKWLHREIVASDTYQRSAETNQTNVADRTNFSHHLPRRLPAEVVYDAVVLATGSDEKVSELRTELDAMAIAEGLPRARNRSDFALQVFGQSIRESNCDCDRSNAPSLLQSIYLRNDSDMHRRLADKDGWVAQACRSLGVDGPDQRIDPRKMAAARAAEGYRKQILAKVRQFNDTPLARRAKMKPRVEQEYRRVKSKFNQFGFEMPPLARLLDNPNAWKQVEPSDDLAKGIQIKAIDELVQDAYLRTLSRYPDDQEQSIASEYIEQSESKAEGVESLLWALVNTKEFIITH